MNTHTYFQYGKIICCEVFMCFLDIRNTVHYSSFFVVLDFCLAI